MTKTGRGRVRRASEKTQRLLIRVKGGRRPGRRVTHAGTSQKKEGSQLCVHLKEKRRWEGKREEEKKKDSQEGADIQRHGSTSGKGVAQNH